MSEQFGPANPNGTSQGGIGSGRDNSNVGFGESHSLERADIIDVLPEPDMEGAKGRCNSTGGMSSYDVEGGQAIIPVQYFMSHCRVGKIVMARSSSLNGVYVARHRRVGKVGHVISGSERDTIGEGFGGVSFGEVCVLLQSVFSRLRAGYHSVDRNYFSRQSGIGART